MDWLCQPFTQVLGIPAFWIARIAKVAQFVAGLYIVADIFGPQRLEEKADEVLSGLSKIIQSRLLGQITTDIWEASKFWLLSGLSKDREKSEEYLQLARQTKSFGPVVEVAVVLGLFSWIISIIMMVVSLFVPDLRGDLSFVDMCGLLLIGWGITIFVWLVLIFAVLNLVRLILLVAVSPIKWAFDLLASHLVRILQKKSLAQLLLILSLCLTVMSCILELLAS